MRGKFTSIKTADSSRASATTNCTLRFDKNGSHVSRTHRSATLLCTTSGAPAARQCCYDCRHLVQNTKRRTVPRIMTGSRREEKAKARQRHSAPRKPRGNGSNRFVASETPLVQGNHVSHRFGYNKPLVTIQFGGTIQNKKQESQTLTAP